MAEGTPMQCEKVRDLLPDYAVEALDVGKRRDVASHLGFCADCREEFDLQERVMRLVSDQGALEPPVGLFNAVRNTIEQGQVARERPAWWSFLWSRPARGAALALSMGAVAMGLLLPAPRMSAPEIEIHAGAGRMVGELASSIRQHAMSAGEGSLTDRVAWEAMAQLATQERSDTGRRDPGVN